jgi:peroxiredoxin
VELAALQEVHTKITALGATLVAVSPQLQKYSQQVVKKNSLSFPVLADPDNSLATRLGLTHTLPVPLRELYSGFGIDLERFNGNSSWSLPLPGRFIVNGQGVIQSVEVHPDYTKRPDPEEIVTFLRTLS